MFLDRCIENNPKLIEYAFKAHQEGLILPDTYILDLDTIKENATKMLEVAKANGIELFFMLKQIGRNPEVAKMLMDLGFKGAVVVDFKEALVMIDNGIHIANVGHLVQTPRHALKKIIASKPDYMTVYSIDKIKEVNEVAKELGIIQKLLIRITDDDAELYSGQVAGFSTDEFVDVINEVESLSNVKIGGVTAFPALLYDSQDDKIEKTDNLKGLERAIDILEGLGYKDFEINIPSATCTASIPTIKMLGGTSGEPGHGLTGTTPLHKVHEEVEKVGYVYVSEVSHNFKDKAYVYGGGTYRRGHMANALVGESFKEAKEYGIKAPDDDSIDYHFELDHNAKVSDTVVMCFRTQIFTTRSYVACVEGLKRNDPKIALYDAVGKKIEDDWTC